MRAPPTELVNCNVAMRAKSLAKLLTIRSICIRDMRGMLLFSLRTFGFQLRGGVPERRACAQVLLHLAHERRVLFEQPAILGADGRRQTQQVAAQIVEHAADGLPIAHAAVEAVEHLVGIVDRGDGPIGAGVDHAGPGVGAVGDHDAEFERAEAGAGAGVALEEVLDFLIDGDAAGPAGRRVAAALHVAGEEFDAGEQTAHAAHVGVAVAADAIADAVQRSACGS